MRRSIAAIERHSSLAAAFAAATARGWQVTQSGFYWQFTDALNRPRRVLGVNAAGMPVFGSYGASEGNSGGGGGVCAAHPVLPLLAGNAALVRIAVSRA